MTFIKLTLDEAIRHYEDMSEIQNKFGLSQTTWKKYDKDYQQIAEWLKDYKRLLKQQLRWIPIEEKYEYHIDHTDCIWYGNDSGCPVTCSQYRDGWNDAMEYIFKGGKGYQPYRRKENG